MKSIEPAANDGTTVRVWDLPTRLFHWSLVGLIGFSWWSAEVKHTNWHMWSGYAVVTLLLFRLLWGVFGSSTARFTNFVRGPRTIAAYLRDVRGWTGTGHNPIGALSVLVLLAALTVQVGTGLIQTDNDGLVEGPLAPMVNFATSDAANVIHKLSFNVLLALIALHVAAIFFYRLVLGRRLVGPMISGSAAPDSVAGPMKSAKWWVAAICLAVALTVTRWIVAGAPPFGG